MKLKEFNTLEGIEKQRRNDLGALVISTIAGFILFSLGIFSLYIKDEIFNTVIIFSLGFFLFVEVIISEIRVRYWDTKYYMFKYFKRDLK